MASVSLSAEPQLAGRTKQEWAALLHHDVPVLRQQAAHALAHFTPPAVNELIVAAKHDDAIVRYWAIKGLKASLGGSNQEMSTRVTAAIKTATTDKSAAVRIAAADALARSGETALARELLLTETKNPVDGARVMAFTALDEQADLPRSLKPLFEKAQDDANEYVKRISKRILGRWN